MKPRWSWARSHVLTRHYKRIPRRPPVAPPPPEPSTMPKKGLLFIGGYAALVNVGAFGLFAYDKFQASHHGWRVRERDLQLSALLGGWIGGLSAMTLFRHKTVKKSFQVPYVLCTAGNIALCAASVAAFRFHPGFRQYVARYLF